MLNIDKTLLNPNIPVTIRFTPVLHEWLHEKARQEDVSFNQIVLLCCKYVLDEENEAAEAKKMGEPHK